MTKRAIIAGGSLAGLMTAILLRRDGWHVEVFEAVGEEMADRGGGIATQDAMWDVASAAGLDVAHRPGVRLVRRVVYGVDGSVVAERAIAEIVSSWDTIYRLLRAAVPSEHYHLGARVARTEHRAAGIAATLADGTPLDADLVVACDGAGSTLRRQHMPQVESIYAGYVAWRGLIAEADLPGIAREDLAGAFSFCLAPGEQMLSYTVPGPCGEEEPGARRHNFVWYQPAEQAHVLPDLLRDADGEVHRPNIPPPLIRDEVVSAMRAHAYRVLSPAYAAMIRAVREPFLQPIADHIAPRLVCGRAVFVGDSGAQARPHVGAGTSKAMLDASALAAALRAHDDVDVALAAYEAERLPAARLMVARGRWLGRGLEPGCDAGEDQASKTLMTMTARLEGWDEQHGRRIAIQA